jgi:two-component system phosphate regulon sensor histidine kinase PhoR
MPKKSMTRTKEQLIIENENLQSRLVEAEETLTAIRNGEVDAILVSGKNEEQIYTINSADTPYRTFIEEMNEGAVTITKDGIILYCNKTFGEIVNHSIEQVIGSDLRSFVAPDEKSKIESFLTLQKNKDDVVIISTNNSLDLKLSLTKLPAYMQDDIYILIVTDISELKRREKELQEIIVKLIHHIQALRELRIDNISETLEVEGRKKLLEIANEKLYKEITKLNRLITKMKKAQKIEHRHLD